MANPQKENGFTAISNEVLEAFCRTRIAGEPRQVLDAILRKTYGFNKISDNISLSQFCQMTLMSKAAICRAIRNLRERKFIITVPGRVATEYKINKNYDQWVDSEPYNREEVFKRDKYMCHICHSVFSVKELEVDHVIPLWLNGSNRQENLATSCRKCNRSKGAERLRYKGDEIATVTELPQWQKRTSKGDKIVSKGVTKLPHTKDNIQNTLQNTLKKAQGVAVEKQGEEIGQARLVAQLIEAFTFLNPACKRMYGNLVQRQACEDLIDTYTYEKVLSVISKTLPKTNQLAYFPTILTPHQLFQDWARLEAAVGKYKSQRLQKETGRGRGLEED
jgi:phage replication O-like protein O